MQDSDREVLCGSVLMHSNGGGERQRSERTTRGTCPRGVDHVAVVASMAQQSSLPDRTPGTRLARSMLLDSHIDTYERSAEWAHPSVVSPGGRLNERVGDAELEAPRAAPGSKQHRAVASGARSRGHVVLEERSLSRRSWNLHSLRSGRRGSTPTLHSEERLIRPFKVHLHLCRTADRG